MMELMASQNRMTLSLKRSPSPIHHLGRCCLLPPPPGFPNLALLAGPRVHSHHHSIQPFFRSLRFSLPPAAFNAHQKVQHCDTTPCCHFANSEKNAIRDTRISRQSTPFRSLHDALLKHRVPQRSQCSAGKRHTRVQFPVRMKSHSQASLQRNSVPCTANLSTIRRAIAHLRSLLSADQPPEKRQLCWGSQLQTAILHLVQVMWQTKLGETRKMRARRTHRRHWRCMLDHVSEASMQRKLVCLVPRLSYACMRCHNIMPTTSMPSQRFASW